MKDIDEQAEEVRGRGRREDGGASILVNRDPRLSTLINWVWATLGGIGLIIGIGVYNKLSEMNDTLIRAVAKIDTQGSQIGELKAELYRQRDEIGALRNQVYVLEGKTLRGIAEAARGN